MITKKGLLCFLKSFIVNIWVFIPPFIAVKLVSGISLKYGMGVSASLYNGELSIFYWTGFVGVSLLVAIPIAIVCGNYDLFMWFWAANHCGWFTRLLLKKFRALDESKFRIWRWFGKVFDFIENIVLGWISSKSYEKIRTKDATYSVLRVLGAIPGLIWVGVAMSKFLDLDQKRAYLCMAEGNTVKMIVIGCLGWAFWIFTKALFSLL